MTAVEIAERKGRMRALAFIFLAGLTLAVMLYVASGRGGDFGQGLWFGLLAGSAVNLVPIKRWLQPNNDMIRMLEDEGVRENRHLSCMAGFWAAIIAALALSIGSRAFGGIGAPQVGQFVATVGIVDAMLTFAILELRGAR